MGYDKFLAAVRRAAPVGRQVRAPLDREGPVGGAGGHGRGGGAAAGALERLHLLLGDWRALRARLADTEARMTAQLATSA